MDASGVNRDMTLSVKISANEISTYVVSSQ